MRQVVGEQGMVRTSSLWKMATRSVEELGGQGMVRTYNWWKRATRSEVKADTRYHSSLT